MKTQRYYDRDRFTEEEKQRIALKSNDCCCHCGRKVYFHYGATVDHFIPLDKGGSNSMYNLIMLCDECNQEKDNKVVSIDYIPHLNNKYKKELSDYVDSYIQVMDYVQRNRLLAYDEYKIPIIVNTNDYKKHKRSEKIVSSFKVKLATWNDLDRLYEYYIKYLKKYDSLDSEQAARENLIFWMQFGCIYYIEQANEISTMIVITIKHVDNDEDFRGIDYIPYMYIFPYYTSEKSIAIIRNMVLRLPLTIIEECGLDFMPFNVLMLSNDKMLSRISYMFGKAYEDNVSGFMRMHYLIGNVNDTTNIHLEVKDMNESERKTYKFLRKFDDVTDKIIKYFSKYSDREDITWMIFGLLSYENIKNSELHKYFDFPTTT